MIPTTSVIEATRYGVRVGLRCLGSLLLLGFILMLLHNSHTRWQQWWGYSAAPTGWDWIAKMAAWDSVWAFLIMGVPGALVLLFERRAARWLVPLPKPGCPGCGYPVTSTMPRCPECGLALETSPGRAPTPSPASKAAP